jgi:hypothetical protein
MNRNRCNFKTLEVKLSKYAVRSMILLVSLIFSLAQYDKVQVVGINEAIEKQAMK